MKEKQKCAAHIAAHRLPGGLYFIGRTFSEADFSIPRQGLSHRE